MNVTDDRQTTDGFATPIWWQNTIELDNTAKRCGTMAVLHLTYYDV